MAPWVGSADLETPAPGIVTRSLDVNAGWVYVLTDGFGEAGPAYSLGVTHVYQLSPHYSVGITLLRFNHHFQRPQNLLTFGYGFRFRHDWREEWGDLGLFVPWASYSILLNQLYESGTKGRAMAHNSRMALGTDLKLAPAWRLTLEAVYDFSDYPTLGAESGRDLHFLSGALGLRFLY